MTHSSSCPASHSGHPEHVVRLVRAGNAIAVVPVEPSPPARQSERDLLRNPAEGWSYDIVRDVWIKS